MCASVSSRISTSGDPALPRQTESAGDGQPRSPPGRAPRFCPQVQVFLKALAVETFPQDVFSLFLGSRPCLEMEDGIMSQDKQLKGR